MRDQLQRGFVLITAGVWAAAMLGMLGLAVDVGRLYIVKSELQTFADSAALAAALELDGSAEGLERARNAVATNANRWNFATAVINGAQTEFSTSPTGPWQSNPIPATSHRFARVSVSASVRLLFLPVVGAGSSGTVRAVAAAGQVNKTSFSEGTFPFSPFAHDASDANFGFVPGYHYTLRWAANPKLNVNVCPGDNAPEWIAKGEDGSSSERGYIEETSSAVIRAAIIADYQTKPLSIGLALTMTGGAKQTQREALQERVRQDSDSVSATYAEYAAGRRGNGRRLVLVPINDGPPNNILVGFALFFLLREEEYVKGGNHPFCAEYVGPYVQGSRTKGAGQAGAYVVRLVA